MTLTSVAYPVSLRSDSIVRENRDETYQSHVVHHKHDRGYKHLLSSKHIFLQMVRSFIKRGWVEHIDESQLIKVDKSYILPDFRGKEADLVYRMKLKEHDVIFYILIEMQSTVDAQMPWRLLQYQVEIWRQTMRDSFRQGQQHSPGFRLPVIVPIVLYNGLSPWTAPLTFRDMLAGEQLFEEDALLNFSYFLLDIQRYTTEDLEKLANVVGSVFLIDRNTHLNVDELMSLFRKLTPVIDALPEEQRGLFATWFEHILRRLIKTVDREHEIKAAVADIHKKGMSPVISNMIKNIDWLEEQLVLKGAEQATETVAQNMLRKGLDISLVAEVTNLSIERIEQLKRLV